VMTLATARMQCGRWRFAFPLQWRRVAICLLCWRGIATAQNGSFSIQTNVVQVPVMVTERNGRYVDGLVARDFKVLDNGAPQQITVDDFSSGLAPISLLPFKRPGSRRQLLP
jgi:hypothetical protein